MKQKLIIVKIGGNVIDNPVKLLEFLKEFATIQAPKILIHGGGKIATSLGTKMEIPQQMIGGRRITNAETLELVTMVYGGLINKNIVANLVALGNNAIGLSGADGDSILSGKRNPIPIDFGFVGDVKVVHTQNIQKLLNAGFVPVFCAITHDGNGQLLNTNADTLTTQIAIAFEHSYDCELYYCFEKKGLLDDVKDEDSVIPNLNFQKYQDLKKEKKIFNGMIPKLDNAFLAVKHGVKKVKILNADDLLDTVAQKASYGTTITQ